MVDRAMGLRIEMNLARQARDYAKDHRVVLPEWGAEVRAVGSGHAVWGSERGAPVIQGGATRTFWPIHQLLVSTTRKRMAQVSSSTR